MLPRPLCEGSDLVVRNTVACRSQKLTANRDIDVASGKHCYFVHPGLAVLAVEAHLGSMRKLLDPPAAMPCPRCKGKWVIDELDLSPGQESLDCPVCHEALDPVPCPSPSDELKSSAIRENLSYLETLWVAADKAYKASLPPLEAGPSWPIASIVRKPWLTYPV